ncbi:MAG TPA: hypothetical protein VGH74_13790, partial [Planctomycetaceae bacterium]
MRRSTLQYRGHSPFSLAAEVCEPRTLLSGPQLVQVTPNTGPAISLAGGTVENQAPSQLVLNFTAGSAITNTAANLANITVTRSGGDGIFGAAGSIADLPVAIGSVQVDSQNSNLVILRFANSLVNDSYQIQIGGALTSSSGAFNSGKPQTVNFAVDYGAQVVSVVPQPVLRTELVKINGTAATLDGQALAISTGGGTPVNFYLRSSSSVLPPPPAGPNNVTVTYNPGDSQAVIAADLANAIQTQATAGGNANLIGTLVTTPSIPSTLSGNSFSLTGTAFTPAVAPAASLLTVVNAGLVADGFTFNVTTPNPANPGAFPQTFQFHDLTKPGSFVIPPNVGVGYHPGDSAGTLAAAMVAAINGSLGANAATFYGATLTVGNAANISDLDKFTITPVGGAAVTFQFKDSTTASVVAAGSVAIVYNPGDSAAKLTNRIAAAIGGSSLGAGSVAPNGAILQLSGNVAVAATTKTAGFLTTVNGLKTVQVNGNRSVTLSANTGFLSVATGLVVSDGGLTQAVNTIDVYFSQDPLNAVLAQDPAFYQVINSATGVTLQPTSVVYNSVGNTAVLTFANALPTGTLQLTVGAPKSNNTTAATATNLGSLGSSSNLVSLTPALGSLTGLAWTSGSATVTGSGFLSAVGLAAGEFLVGPDGANYQIQAGFSD